MARLRVVRLDMAGNARQAWQVADCHGGAVQARLVRDGLGEDVAAGRPMQGGFGSGMAWSYFPYPNRGMLASTRYDGSAYHRARASAMDWVGPHHVTSPVSLLTTDRYRVGELAHTARSRNARTVALIPTLP